MNGEKIHKLREERGLSQRAVSIGTGLTENSLYSYESGKGNPTLATTKKIADFYGVPVSEIVED